MTRLCTRLLALGILLSVVPAYSSARCGPSRMTTSGISKPREIALEGSRRGVYAGPAFYLRVITNPNRPLVLFFKPEDVVAALQNDSWLAVIQQDLPLHTDTDLFKYRLRGTRYWFGLEALVTELLGSGRAAVALAGHAGDLTDPERGNIPSIVMVTEGKERAFWFCTQDGLELHAEYRVLE